MSTFDFNQACEAMSARLRQTLSAEGMADAWRLVFRRALLSETRVTELSKRPKSLEAVQKALLKRFWESYSKSEPVPWAEAPVDNSVSSCQGQVMDVSVMKAAFTMSRTDMEAALRMLATNSIDGVNKESTEAQERDDEIRILKDRLRQADDYIRFSEDSYRGVKRNYRELSLENYELTIENRRLKDQIRALDSAMTTPQEPRSGQILPVQAHQPPTLDSWQAPRSGQQSSSYKKSPLRFREHQPETIMLPTARKTHGTRPLRFRECKLQAK
ncbi:hypothetical protein F5X97DRAFT_323464 [Nemania serpens]|nr:hypothetical protein F5X97DRAFT_323464 [Nemania serpens]